VNGLLNTTKSGNADVDTRTDHSDQACDPQAADAQETQGEAAGDRTWVLVLEMQVAAGEMPVSCE